MFSHENPVQPVPHPTEPNQHPLPSPESGFLELVQRLIDDLITWITLEGDLARAEVTEKARAALRGLALGLTGVVLLLCGGVAVLLAIGFAVSGALERAGIDPAFSHALGFLSTGLLGAFAGWIVMQQAKAILSPANLSPSRTTATLRRATAWVCTKLHLQRHDQS